MRHSSNRRMATAAAAAVMVSPSVYVVGGNSDSQNHNHQSSTAVLTSTTRTTSPRTHRLLTEELMELLQHARKEITTTITIDNQTLPAAYIKRLLTTSTHIRHLRLHHIATTQMCVAPAMRTFLHSNRDTLVALHLSKNAGWSDATAAAVMAHLPPHVRELHWEGCRLSPTRLVDLCERLSTTCVTTLHVGHQPWTDPTVVAALTKLLTSPSCRLTHLDIRGSGIPAAATWLRAAVQRLSVLGLARNDWTDADVGVLWTVLQDDRSRLTTLDLRYHPRLTQVQPLVDGLDTCNHRLRKVKLRHCDAIPRDAKEDLLQALLVNSHGPVLAEQTKRMQRQVLLQQPGVVEPKEPEEEDDDCVICFNPSNNKEGCCYLLPCAHHNCCATCAQQLTVCHMCRSPVVKVVVAAHNNNQ